MMLLSPGKNQPEGKSLRNIHTNSPYLTDTFLRSLVIFHSTCIYAVDAAVTIIADPCLYLDSDNR